MPPGRLRKWCADARWPSDLCLLLMLRKAVFFFYWCGIYFFLFTFWVCLLLLTLMMPMLASDMRGVVFSRGDIDQRGENNGRCLIKLKSCLFFTGSSSSCLAGAVVRGLSAAINTEAVIVRIIWSLLCWPSIVSSLCFSPCYQTMAADAAGLGWSGSSEIHLLFKVKGQEWLKLDPG